MSIINIIQGCTERDPNSQRLLYNQFKGFACKIVFRYIYRYEKAMDVVTDGFVKVLLNIHTFDYLLVSDAEKQLMGWIKKIMINCAIDELRRNNMLPEIGELTKELWETDSEKHTADQLLLYKDLVNLIKELPTNYRVIFNLYVIDGYSHSEIADKLKISVSTSRSGLSRARTILQTTIIKMEEGEACSI